MTKEIIILIGCVPLYAVNAFCDKAISTKNENEYNGIYNCIKFFICAICVVPLLFFDKANIFTIGAFLCGALSGVMYAVGKTAMLKGYDKTSVAFMTLCHASGMILPCIIGHFFWNEKLDGISIFGILLTIFSIVLIKGRGGKNQPLEIKGVLYGLLAFLTSAGVMVAQKLMGSYFSEQNAVAYSFYAYTVAFFLLSFFIKSKQIKAVKKNGWKTVLACAIGSAISLVVINFVMVDLAGAVPSIILFPLFNGLGVMFVCIGSAAIFKEKIHVLQWIGLILALLGLFLVNC